MMALIDEVDIDKHDDHDDDSDHTDYLIVMAKTTMI